MDPAYFRFLNVTVPRYMLSGALILVNFFHEIQQDTPVVNGLGSNERLYQNSLEFYTIGLSGQVEVTVFVRRNPAKPSQVCPYLRQPVICQVFQTIRLARLLRMCTPGPQFILIEVACRGTPVPDPWISTQSVSGRDFDEDFSPTIKFCLKDKLPRSTTSFSVCPFVCSCRALYVGRTKRHLSHGMGEHNPVSLSGRGKKPGPSPIASHLAETTHVTEKEQAFQSRI
ncbi:hypothetical protein T265_01906 [Opisthorchis viverrini]|uniref:Uncharacterized protein n=1 Tax=Opisthorchis viverrini TaxID=6198 RepID=A0A075AIP1_OPIVI|nr:hypothetical protein T265_01906 [Opisthorchis viverrini]KER31974.1 hypothetical protein T265_01906 [Opisthorchis viverrini]